MLRLLLVAILAVPLPPQEPLVYVVSERFSDARVSGFYNITLRYASGLYVAEESRNAGSNGSDVVTLSGQRFGPGKLRYPVLFFDPEKRLDAILRLASRLVKRNGTRENYTINIKHTSVYVFDARRDATGLYVKAYREGENVTDTLEAAYILVDSLGLTYYLSISVYGSAEYSLSAKLVEASSRPAISLKASAIAAALGIAALIIIYASIVRKYKRTPTGKHRWPVISSRIGSIPRTPSFRPRSFTKE